MDAPRRRRHRRPISTINVTPLVDVMLVLLIIFMVTISLQQQGIGVDLPAVRAGAVADNADIVVVSIDRNRQVFINNLPIDRRQLTAALQSRFAAQKPKAVYLKSDRTVAYGDFVAVVGLIKEAGVEHLSMITEPPEK